jgi:purine-binding chemotaxis protein CheW
MGVFDLRGKVVPVIDLSRKFRIDSNRQSKPTRAIVVDIGGKQVGLAIDSVSHVVKINSNDIEPPPPVVKGISGRYIIGIAKLERGFVVVLDINQIFSSEEISSL